MTLFKKRSLVRPSTPKDIVDTMVGEGLETPALKQLKISNEIYMKSRTQKQISKSENGKSANPSLIASLSILAHSVPSAATAAAASAVSSPSPSVIPQKQVRKSKAYSKEGAGYVASQREVKFDQLIKTKDEIKKSLQILASNTAKNGNVPVAAVETKKEILESVNSRWKQQMMSVAADKETPSKAKAKKNITFNEKVTCHKISRIQDIIEEYDVFEEAFYNECEARFADLDASMGKSEKDVPIVDLSFTEESTVQSTEDQEPQVAELSVCEIMESATDGLMPQSISRMENFFQEARKSKYSHADSITSLGPACPTPDRCNSPSDINPTDMIPAPLTDSIGGELPKSDHLDDLDRLFNPPSQDTIPHETHVAPVTTFAISTTSLDSETTLLSTASSQDSKTKYSFWDMLTRLFHLQPPTKKVHPV